MTEDYTKIFIRNLRLEMSIGVHDHEKKKSQPVAVDLEATVSPGRPAGENIENVVCYDSLAKTVRALVQQGHINLVETLAERVAQSCLEDKRILDVKVRIGKPDALPDAEAAGAEIFRKQR